MDFLIRNREWIFSGVGVAALTLLVASVPRLIALVRQVRRGIGRFTGIYEVLILRIRNDGTYLRSALQVGSSVLGTPVTFNSYRYRYRGKLRLLGHNVFITMRGLNHDGYMYCVFKEPLGHFDVLTGVFAAITTNRLPVAGRILLRRVHGVDAANVVPAFLAATEVSATAKTLLKNETGDLIIVPDLPIWQYRELEEGGAEWKQGKPRTTKKTK